jgi:hypothetical protein
MQGTRLLVTIAVVMGAAVAARAQQAGSDWTRLQAVQSGTLLRVSSQRRPTICSFVAADSDSLTCMQTQTIFFFPVRHRLVFMQPEVTLVKVSRYALSTLAGAGIGAGAGAGIGAAIDASAKNQVEEGHLVTAVFGVLGGALGAGIGGTADFLAGPVIYRAP